MTIRTRITGLAALALLSLAGCEEKKSETKPTAEDDAAAQQGPALDPDLAEAVEAASARKKGAPGSEAGGPGKGPPPDGIFGPGEANAECAKGTPPKITLGSEGSEPRVKLASAPPPPGWKRSGRLEFSLRAGRSQLPAITADIALDAPKAAAKPAAAGEAAPAAPGAAVVGKVVKATLAAGELGAPAAELAGVVGKMKGSRLSFRVLPSGASDDFSVDLAKDAAKDLDALLRPLSEVLAAVTMPFPDKAVGKGAYWMVTSRETVTGVDVVTYRLVRVDDVQGDTLLLNLSIKRYAASNDLSLPGVPPDAKLEQFQSMAEGKVTVSASSPLIPTSGNLQQNFVAILTPPAGGDPNQRLTAQTASEAKLDFPIPGAKPAAKPAAAPQTSAP